MSKALIGLLSAAVFACVSVCVLAEARVSLQLAYPAGQSPKVFTTGWVFGAKAIANGKDISGDVEWSGTAKYPHPKGDTNHPTFDKPGANTITLSVEFGGKRYGRDFAVNAISPEGYAALGDKLGQGMCCMGCPGCPHPVNGVITTGSSNVQIGGRPAARKGDKGTHGPCCGSGISEILQGDSTVLIDGKPAARKGDKVSTDNGTCIILGTPPAQSQPAKPNQPEKPGLRRPAA